MDHATSRSTANGDRKLARSSGVGASLAVFAVALAIATPSPSTACPFCSNMGKTLTENVDEAAMVIYGSLYNAKTDGQSDGTTDFDIETVVKGHPVLGDKKKIVLPRFIPGAEKNRIESLIFAEVVDGKIDPYRSIPVDSKDFVNYLVGSVKMAKAKGPDKLGFYFNYLGDKDINISGDAYKEFANAPYSDVVVAAKSFDPEKLLTWLRDKETPSYRIGLYGCLLGACGRPSDSAILLDIISSPETRPLTGVDGLMGGYCVLDPKRGTDFTLTALTNPKEDFNFRYNALRTVRFVLTEMAQADKAQVDKKMVLERMSKAIEIPDISDLVVDELRKNEYWAPLPQILSLYANPKFDLQVVRRSVIRFALKCPDPKAKDFLATLRKQDPQLLSDVEEILRFEETQLKRVGTGGA